MAIRKTSVAILASALLLAVAACTSTHGTATPATPSSAPTTVTTPASEPPVTEPPNTEPPTPTPSPTSTVEKIGGSFTYTDGLQVRVTSAVKFTPSDTSAGFVQGQAGVLVTVSVTNATASTFDLSGAQVDVLAGAAGNQASSIFDSSNNLGSGLTGSVPPGHTATARYGFSVAPADLRAIVVNVKPGFNYDTAAFEGAVG